MEDNLALVFLNVYSIYTGPDALPVRKGKLEFTDEQDRQLGKEYNRLHYYLLYNPSSETDIDATLSKVEKRIRRMMRFKSQSYYRMIRAMVVQGDPARPLYDKIVEAFEENLNIEFEFPSKNISELKSNVFQKRHEIAPVVLRQ